MCCIIPVSCFVRSTLSLARAPQVCAGANCSTGSIEFVATYYCWVRHLYSLLVIDILFFAVFCQLKSYPELYMGYVPMEYSDYLKKMSKYVYICHHPLGYAISDDMALSLFLCLLIAFCADVLGVVNGVITSHCRLLPIGYEEIYNFHFVFAFPIIQPSFWAAVQVCIYI